MGGLIAFGAALCLIAMWSLNVAPALNFPLGPELVVVGLALGVSSLLWSRLPADKRTWSFLFLSKPRRTAAYLLPVAVMLLLGRGLDAFFGSAYRKTCSAMPGLVQKLECIFQAGVDQNYALRNLSYAITAMVVVVCGLLLGRSRAHHKLPMAIATVAVLFSMISIVSMMTGTAQLLPRYVLLNEFGLQRMTFLMQNPTWIWTYLLPGLLSLLWIMGCSKSPRLKIFAAIGLLPVLFTIVRSQQRGAILLALLLGFGLCINFALELAKKLETRRDKLVVFFSTALVLTAVSTWFVLEGYELVAFGLGQLGFGDRLSGMDLGSQPRFLIWSAAWEGIKSSPWWGHGYASWYEEFGRLAEIYKVKYHLDTAHNNIVQSIFELGVLQTLLNYGLFASFLVFAWRSSAEKKQHRWITVFLICGYSAVLLVQEFNFVRSAYYTHALFFGWFLGTGFRECAVDKNVRTMPVRVPGWIKKTMAKVSPHGHRILIICAGGLVFFGLSTLYWFSLGGYQYEANVMHGYGPKVRWFRPYGTATFVETHISAPEYFAVYSIGKSFANAYSLGDSPDGSRTRYALLSQGENFLPLRARQFWERPSTLSFDDGREEGGRVLSAMVFWPPVRTELPLVWAQNLGPWEYGDDKPKRAIKACLQECKVRFLDCDAGKRMLELVVRASGDQSKLYVTSKEFTSEGSVTSVLYEGAAKAESTHVVAFENYQDIEIKLLDGEGSQSDDGERSVQLIASSCMFP